MNGDKENKHEVPFDLLRKRIIINKLNDIKLYSHIWKKKEFVNRMNEVIQIVESI